MNENRFGDNILLKERPKLLTTAELFMRFMNQIQYTFLCVNKFLFCYSVPISHIRFSENEMQRVKRTGCSNMTLFQLFWLLRCANAGMAERTAARSFNCL